MYNRLHSIVEREHIMQLKTAISAVGLSMTSFFAQAGNSLPVQPHAKNDNIGYVLTLGTSETALVAPSIKEALGKAVEISAAQRSLYPRNYGNTNSAGNIYLKDDTKKSILATCFITKTSSDAPIGGLAMRMSLGGDYKATCKTSGPNPVSVDKFFNASGWTP